MQLISNGKPVYFEQGLQQLPAIIKANGYSGVFVLTDDNTSEICLPVFREMLGDFADFSLIETVAGEEHKTIDFCIGIWNTLLDFEADRRALLINLGGGVITDMGGFVAATYKRGLDFINIPTTLLAQVDASVGGKTGIDLDNHKNMVGTFSIPEAVFIEHRFLATLPDRELLSGFAELLKHGLIADKALFLSLADGDISNIDPATVRRSVKIKQQVVAEDPKEQGLRKILNYGHTVGHAIEGISLAHDKKPLTHGEAIAIGMICEAFLSHKLNNLAAAELNQIATKIARFYTHYDLDISKHVALLDLLQHDKKNEGGKILCSLLSGIGACDFNVEITPADVLESLAYYQQRTWELGV